MQQPSPDGAGGPEHPRPTGVVSFNNVQLMRPGAPGTQKSVATVNPRVIVGNPIQRPGPSAITQEMLQNMQGPPQAQGQGHVFVKSDGRYQLVRVGAGPMMSAQGRGRPANLPAMPTSVQSEVMVPMSVISAQGVQTIQPQQMGQMIQQQQYPRIPQMQQIQLQQQIQMPLQLSGSVPMLQPPQQGFSQGSPLRVIKPPDSSKDKCRNFLANLLELSSNEPPSVERSVRALIQDLIDGSVQAAEFCSRLERLLNANSQPCLVGFLMKSLPMLRHSMAQQELVIPGVRPPPLRVAYPPAPASAAAPAPPAQPAYSVAMPQDPVPRKLEMRQPAASYDVAADDDLNDVAAMGGVNLREEAQRILGGAGHVGSLIRSCGAGASEPGVRARVRVACLARGLAEPPPEVAALLSAALHERMRTLLQRVTCSAAHRQDLECKTDGRYEVSQDVKSQLKFLEELDRVEKRRREETERELLLRAAKSRSKTEDPEQAKLKAKAKEMQRVEMEEVRQREANLTALQAIGTRKRARPEPAPAPQPGAHAPAQVARRSRLLRVTLRDMLHMLENDRTYAHSPILYKAYLKA